MRISDRITFDDEYIIRRENSGYIIRMCTNEGWELVLTSGNLSVIPLLRYDDRRLRFYSTISKQDAEDLIHNRKTDG